MTTFEMLLHDLRQEQIEKQNRLMPMLQDAVAREDWEKVKSLITLVPELMAAGLKYAYPYLPDEYKFSIPTECYTHNGDRMPVVRRYVRQAKKFAPIEKRIPAEMINRKEIVVYRGGCEPITKARYHISWTDKLDKAQWFYERALYNGAAECHLYRGIIKPKNIIWYTNGREESEIMQYGSVANIEEIGQ